jgi:hypothetical protein
VGTDQRGDDGGGAETVWALARSGGLASAVVIEEIGERGGELVRVGSLGRRQWVGPEGAEELVRKKRQSGRDCRGGARPSAVQLGPDHGFDGGRAIAA